MRDKLQTRDGERFRIRATVSRLGVRQTVLLIDGIDAETGKSLFDHLWLTTREWARIPLPDDVIGWRAMRPGDVIEFDARAGSYIKGYFGHRSDVDKPAALDWSLMRPRTRA